MADTNGKVKGLNVIKWWIMRIVTGNTELHLSGHRFRQILFLAIASSAGAPIT